MAGEDLEPIELEPLDLDGGGPRFGRGPAPTRSRLWFAVAAAGLAVWIIVAAMTHGHRGHPAAANATTTSIPIGSTADPVAPSAVTLQTRLRGIGSGRFAAVIRDRLYVIDTSTASPLLVPLSDSPAVIQDQSGSSLLASSIDSVLVSTQPFGVRPLASNDVAVRGFRPNVWWLQNDELTIRRADDNVSLGLPDRLRVVAEVRDGFVGLDARSRWVLWSDTTTPIARVGDQFLAVGPDVVAFKRNCNYGGCSIVIVDLARHTTAEGFENRIPAFAAFSPGGSRLALASTQGDLYIVDTRTGAPIAEGTVINRSSPSLPFTWTPSGRNLLVVRDHDIEVRRASDGAVTRKIPVPDGVEQLVALP